MVSPFSQVPGFGLLLHSFKTSTTPPVSGQTDMNRFQLWSVGVVLFIFALAAFAQIISVPPGTFKIPPPPFNNSILPGTNELPHLETKKLGDLSSLPPGVYVTKPYACMVKIPGTTHDDIAVRKVTVPTNSTMPVLRPDLRAAPLGRSSE